MNNLWLEILNENLSQKQNNDLYRNLKILDDNTGRTIKIGNKNLINFASNDYLGLAHDKRLIQSGYNLSMTYGAGSGSSRSISGTCRPFNDIESQLAKWVGKQKGLIFNSGYHANIGLLSSLADRNTVIFTDKLNHASIYDGIILSRANMVRYPHRDIDALKKLLEKHNNYKKKILITDAVFSMDGDIAPLKELAKLSKKHGVLTIVDEAHSFGVFGKDGNGLIAQLELVDDIDIIMGTLGKSFGSFGAFVLSDKLLIDFLINNCRPFIFTTALPPFITGCVNKALNIIKEEKRGEYILKLAKTLKLLLNNIGINTGDSESQIIPIIVKENKKAISLMNHLMDNGFFAPAIRPPTVPENSSRIRLSLSYYHKESDITDIFNCIERWFKNQQ